MFGAEVVLGAGLMGFAWGFVAGRRKPAPTADKPLQLVTVHSYTAPAGLVHDAAQVSMWPLYTTSFAFHANLLGSFSYRAMAAAGVCRRAAWETYTGLLREAGVIQAAPRSATTWAGGWCYSRLRAEVKHNRLALPFPAGDPPAINSAKLATQLAQASAAHTGGTP